ncbi:MAG TPA: phosphosugar isomerase [Mesotoga infera]|nr:SIS domain-containing protein [Thermotogaceae bacterium]HPD37889.1 phosphosugar isomerase [Mesotoga infera]HRV01326.1 phosphosugar isomerase [Mesotoga sp.]
MSQFKQDFMEQPEAVRLLLSTADDISEKSRKLDSSRVLFTGMGASLHAGSVAATFLRSLGIDSDCVEMSELISYSSPDLLKNYGTIVLISQSGESAELLRFMDDNASLLDRMTLVTNNPSSTAGKRLEREKVFPLLAGKERSMGATKTFINSILTTLLMALTWSGTRIDFSKLPESIEEAFETDVTHLVELLAGNRERILVARGYGIGVAKMARLMFAEVSKLSLVFYSGAAFRHGPLELLNDRPVVMTMNPYGETSALMEELHRDIYQKCELITLTNFQSACERSIKVSIGLPEIIAPIPMMAVLQKIANELALKRGFDPGKGIFGSKVTVKE